MDYAAWLDRVEKVLEELGWSGRELCRRAGLKNEAQFAVTSIRIRTKARAQPSAMVVDGLTSALARAGYSERWLRFAFDLLGVHRRRSVSPRDGGRITPRGEAKTASGAM